MTRTAFLAVIAFLLLVLSSLAWYARDDLRVWTRPLFQTAVQTSGLGHCTAPSEGEQLVVIFGRQGNKIVFKECFFSGSRGTYTPPRRGLGS